MQKEVIAGGDSLPALQFCGGTVGIKGCLEVCVVVVNKSCFFVVVVTSLII